MRMKQISVLMAAMVLVSNVLAQERERMPPKLEQVKSITLHTKPARWKGIFYSNGAAKLEWCGGTGFSGFLDNTDAVAPRGSFSLKEVYNLLVPCLKLDGDSRTAMSVHIEYDTSQETFYGGYLTQTEENKKIVRKLMGRLYNKVVPRNKGIFEKLLGEHPLLAGDMPVSHVYKEDPGQTAFRIAEGDTIDWQLMESEPKRRIKERRVAEGLPPILTEKEERDIKEDIARSQAFYESLRESQQGKAANRPWLYAGILAALCAGIALWFIRRKKRSPS